MLCLSKCHAGTEFYLKVITLKMCVLGIGLNILGALGREKTKLRKQIYALLAKRGCRGRKKGIFMMSYYVTAGVTQVLDCHLE